MFTAVSTRQLDTGVTKHAPYSSIFSTMSEVSRIVSFPLHLTQATRCIRKSWANLLHRSVKHHSNVVTCGRDECRWPGWESFEWPQSPLHSLTRQFSRIHREVFYRLKTKVPDTASDFDRRTWQGTFASYVFESCIRTGSRWGTCIF